MAVVLALAVGLAGCGGSSSKNASSSSSATSAHSWANGLCNSILTWQNNLRSAGASFRANPTEHGLSAAASSVTSANAMLKSSFEALGKPPTPGATATKASVEKLVSDLKSTAKQIDDAVQSVSKGTDVKTAYATAREAFATMRQETAATVKQIQTAAGDQPWKQAFANADACKHLASA